MSVVSIQTTKTGGSDANRWTTKRELKRSAVQIKWADGCEYPAREHDTCAVCVALDICKHTRPTRQTRTQPDKTTAIGPVDVHGK